MRSKKRPGAGGGRGEGEEETFGIETEQSTGGAELISFTPAPRRRLSSGRHAGGAPRVPRGRRSATTATQQPAAAPSAELRRLLTATRSREPLGGGRGGAAARSAAPHREVAAAVRSVPRCGSRSPYGAGGSAAHVQLVLQRGVVLLPSRGGIALRMLGPHPCLRAVGSDPAAAPGAIPGQKGKVTENRAGSPNVVPSGVSVPRTAAATEAPWRVPGPKHRRRVQRFHQQTLTVAPSHTQHSAFPSPQPQQRAVPRTRPRAPQEEGCSLQDAELMQLIFNAEKPWGNSTGLEGGQREPDG